MYWLDGFTEPRSPGSPSSVDFARPRLNFTGNCPNWHRRLVSSSVLSPLRLSSKSIAALNVCIGWIWIAPRATPRQLDFSADPLSLLLTMTVQFGHQILFLRSCDQVQSNRPLALPLAHPPRHDSILIAAVTIPLGGWNEISRRRVAVLRPHVRL